MSAQGRPVTNGFLLVSFARVTHVQKLSIKASLFSSHLCPSPSAYNQPSLYTKFTLNTKTCKLGGVNNCLLSVHIVFIDSSSLPPIYITRHFILFSCGKRGLSFTELRVTSIRGGLGGLCNCPSLF